MGAIAFSQQGALFARGDNRQAVITSADAGKAVSRLRGYAQEGSALSVSRDNRFIAAGTALWDNQTGRLRPALAGQPGQIVDLSPDGKTLAIGIAGPDGRYRQIVLWDLQKGSEIRRLERPGAVVQGYSPDGRFLLLRAAQQLCLIETSTSMLVAFSGRRWRRRPSILLAGRRCDRFR